MIKLFGMKTTSRNHPVTQYYIGPLSKWVNANNANYDFKARNAFQDELCKCELKDASFNGPQYHSSHNVLGNNKRTYYS